MKTDKEIKEEIEKGCGKLTIIDFGIMQRAECGAINPINKRIILCPTCQRKVRKRVNQQKQK